MQAEDINRALPEERGIQRKSIDEFVRRLYQAGIPMHSILLFKDDRLVFEAYQPPYTRNSLHRMFSVTKSFVSLAVGLLAQEGKLSLEDPIVKYFPDKLPEKVHPYIQAITIRNMLTMRTAHHKTTYKLAGCTDWVKSFFETEPSHYPGTFFAYDTSSTHVLAALVERLTGQSLLDYMRGKFLDDIGFSKEAYCITDPMGISMGGSGLMAAPLDILKVMRLIMDGGVYRGKQYLPKEYLNEALTPWSDNYAISSSLEEMQGYGYQFWKTTHNGFVCYGMGGQLGLCLPEYRTILVTTADTQGRQGGVQLIYDAFWDTIYRDLEDPEKKDLSFAAGKEGLRDRGVMAPEKLEQICLPSSQTGLCAAVEGKKIIVDRNEQGFTSFTLHFEEKRGTVTYENASGCHCLEFGIGENIETVFPYYGHRALVSGAWRNGSTFLIYGQIIDEYVGKVFMNFSFQDGHVGIMLKKIEETYYKEFNLFTSGTIQGD